MGHRRRPTAAHAETAVAAPALTWYLAEGATHSGFNLFYLLQNPNAAEAQVRVRYLRPSGAPLEKTYTLPPTSRTNIWVDLEEFPGLGQALANTDVSAVFEVLNGQPIIVERAMYLDVPGQTFGAGHESAGITAPATEWFLAEGATGPYFDLFVLIANPGDTDAQVEATYLLPDGTTVVKPYTVAANSRFNIWVDYEDAQLADTAVSTTIRSTNGVPIIVERAMWWPDGGWYEAHNSPGATTTGTKWALAEGEVDASRNLETYILVANTSATPADVKVTLLFEDGTSAEQTYAGIPAKSRFNVPVGGFFPQAAGSGSARSSRASARRRRRSSSSGRCTGTRPGSAGRRGPTRSRRSCSRVQGRLTPTGDCSPRAERRRAGSREDISSPWPPPARTRRRPRGSCRARGPARRHRRRA